MLIEINLMNFENAEPIEVQHFESAETCENVFGTHLNTFNPKPSRFRLFSKVENVESMEFQDPMVVITVEAKIVQEKLIENERIMDYEKTSNKFNSWMSNIINHKNNIEYIKNLQY